MNKYFKGRYRNTAVLVLAVFGIFVFTFIIPTHTLSFFPKPTEGTFESGKEGEEELKRIQWIEHMHQAAPGINWKNIEQQTRWAKYLSRKGSSSHNRMASVDTIANGLLTGNWNEKGSANQSGRIVVAEFDSVNNKVYCGSAGGVVWKGNLNGTGWTPLNDHLRFDDIRMIRVIPFGAGHRILVASSGQPFFSYTDDDGVNWHNSAGLSYISGWGNMERAVVTDDANRSIYILAHEWDTVNWNSQSTIYRSIDNGVNFNPIAAYPTVNFGDIGDVDIWAPHGGDTLYLINQNGSNVTLSKFDPVSGIPQVFSNFSFNSGNRILLTGTRSPNPVLYAYSDKSIYRSSDGGINWNFRSTVAEDYFSRNSFCCSYKDSDIIYFGGMQAYRSLDGGSNFLLVSAWQNYYNNPSGNLHADIPCILPYNNNGEKFFIGTDGGLYTSADSLHTIQNISLNGLNASQYYSTYTNRNNTNYVFAGAQDQGYQRCRVDSNTILGFEQKASGDYSHFVSADGGNSIWMVYPSFAACIANAPNTNGQFTATWDFNGATNFWMPPLMADPFGNSGICYVAGKSINTSGSHIIKMIRAGASINATEMTFDFFAASGGYVSAVAASPVNHNDWYALTDNGKFFYSSDAGQNWIQSGFTGPSPHYFYGSAIYVSKLHPGTVVIGGSGYSNSPAYITTDYGQNFTSINSGLPPTLIFEIKADENEDFLFAATDAGPYVYSFAQNQWYDMTIGSAPDQVYWGVDYIPLTHTVRFATYGRGIWDFQIQSGLSTGIFNIADNNINIYPNPGTGIFHISSQAGNITVFNQAGKLICKKSGNMFDISDQPKGMYFVEVQSGDKKYIKKVVVE